MEREREKERISIHIAAGEPRGKAVPVCSSAVHHPVLIYTADSSPGTSNHLQVGPCSQAMTSPGQLVWHVDFEAKRLAGRVVDLSLGSANGSGAGSMEI